MSLLSNLTKLLDWEAEEREYQKIKKMIDKKEKKELDKWIKDFNREDRRELRNLKKFE